MNLYTFYHDGQVFDILAHNAGSAQAAAYKRLAYGKLPPGYRWIVKAGGSGLGFYFESKPWST